MSLFPDSVKVWSNTYDDIVLKTFEEIASYEVMVSICQNAKHMVLAGVMEGGGYKIRLASLIDGSIVCNGYIESTVSCIVCSQDGTTIALACISHHYFDKSSPVGRLVLLDAESLEIKNDIIIETGNKRADFSSCNFNHMNQYLMFVVVRPHGAEFNEGSRVGLLDTRTKQFVWSCQGINVTDFHEKIILPYSGELILYMSATTHYLIVANSETGEEKARYKLHGNINNMELSPDSRTVAFNYFESGKISVLNCIDLSHVATVGPFFKLERFFFDEGRVVVWGRENKRYVAGIGDIVVSASTMKNEITVYTKNAVIANIREIICFPDGSGRMLGRCGHDVVVFHPKGARNYGMTKIIVAAAAGMRRKLVIPEELWKLINDKFCF